MQENTSQQTLEIVYHKKQNITASISQLDNKKIEKFSFKNKNEINKAISNINKKKFNITDISSKIISSALNSQNNFTAFMGSPR